MESLVSTDWLAGELGADDLRVVDASWFLPEHGRDARAGFAAGHIPGAVFLDLDAVADRHAGLPHMLPGGAAFARAMGALGLSDRDRIVVYDDSPLRSAARGWWMLRVMGARHVAILDGGLAKWRAEGRPVETGPATPAPATFTVLGDATRVVDLPAMKQAVAHREQIVDARSPGRFAGAEPEPRAGVVPGHMPGADNVHYATLYNPDGTWKSPGELADVFAAADVEIDHPVIATCGSGVTAAAIVFALHLLGQDASLYDGSWAEWGADPSTPKATARG